MIVEAPFRRLEPQPETTLYVARAGLGALPSGFLTVLVFMMPQILSLGFVLWAIWWPYPEATPEYDRALLWTAVMTGTIIAVATLLARRHRGFILAVVRAPFIRITLTDRRLLWTLPWSAEPLLEIDRRRMVRGVLGSVDRRGRGNAAIELLPGDPAADVDGHIHFDRLPAALAFVTALSG